MFGGERERGSSTFEAYIQTWRDEEHGGERAGA
jgi:hypothetical protein